jgi:hypothetical protein
VEENRAALGATTDTTKPQTPLLADGSQGFQSRQVPKWTRGAGRGGGRKNPPTWVMPFSKIGRRNLLISIRVGGIIPIFLQPSYSFCLLFYYFFFCAQPANTHTHAYVQRDGSETRDRTNPGERNRMCE